METMLGIDELCHALGEGTSDTEKIRVLRERYAPLARADTPGWFAEFVEVAARCELSIEVERQVTTTLAWHARLATTPVPRAEDLPAAVRDKCGRRLVAYVAGQQLRFRYRLGELERCARIWQREVPGDALVLAMLSAARFGQSYGTDGPDGVRFLDASLASPNADQVSRSVCLWALWLADDFPQQGERLLNLADEMIARGEDDFYHHYLRTAGLRRVGRYDEALASIDRAIEMMVGRDDTEHDHFLRERDQTALMRTVDRQVSTVANRLTEEMSEAIEERVTRAQDALERQAEAVRATLSDAVMKIVEVIAVFLALVGFVVGGSATALQAKGFWQLFAVVGLMLGGTVVLFALLHWIVGYGRRPGSRLHRATADQPAPGDRRPAPVPAARHGR